MKLYLDNEIKRMRNCQCKIPCIVYCNVVLRELNIQDWEEEE